MGDDGEAAHQLLRAGDLAEVPLGQLEHSQDVQPQQVARGLSGEDIGQLQQSRAGHDRERELLHESWELDDGLALLPHCSAAQSWVMWGTLMRNLNRL